MSAAEAVPARRGELTGSAQSSLSAGLPLSA